MTAVYGIFGYPVAHSRSPALHNAAFAKLGIDATYVPFEVAPEALEHALRGAIAMGIAGLNVTLPHKTAIMALLDEVRPDAAAIGAVNTVIIEGGRSIGENTDAGGLARSLPHADVTLEGARVTVLGAGGAVRAAVVGIGRAGARSIAVAARRLGAAQELVDALSPTLPNTSLRALSLGQDATAKDGLSAAFGDSNRLVQGTSATLEGNPDAKKFAESLPLDALAAGCVVTDLVYKPRITSVMELAQARGHRVVDGSGMLLHQGALAFERWTGRDAPVDAMAGALAG